MQKDNIHNYFFVYFVVCLFVCLFKKANKQNTHVLRMQEFVFWMGELESVSAIEKSKIY